MRCSECKRLYSDPGFSGGSEETGDSPPTIYCGAGHWNFNFDDARGSLREIARIGAECKDFEEQTK